MERVSLYRYYSFGFNYHILFSNASTWTNDNYLEQLNSYSKLLNDLDLRVTIKAADSLDLQGYIEKVKKLAKARKTKNEVIPKDLHDEIEKIIQKVDLTLDSELKLRHAFLLGEKRWSNEILTSRIDKLFAEDVYNILPKVASFDFQEAGMCMALDRYTACAFHALRGTEDVLRFYYENLLKVTCKGTETWGKYVKDIQDKTNEKKITPAPSAELMINLDNLRKYYRNKTQHPQLIFSSDEVQDLLSHCIKTVNQVINELISRKLVDPLF